MCFNSYMVRLEGLMMRTLVRGRLVSIPIWCDWKANLLRPLLQHPGCFNSYMVRLEACVLGEPSRRHRKFQLLYGAIGRF